LTRKKNKKQEFQKKVTSSRLKKRLTTTHKNKIRKKQIGKDNSMFGRKHSKKTKRKISFKLLKRKEEKNSEKKHSGFF
jgi:hypothetical protein